MKLRRGSIWTVIELLLSIVIIAVLAYILMNYLGAIGRRVTGVPGGEGIAGGPEGAPKSPIGLAKATQCKVNLTNVRRAITAFQSIEGYNPPNIQLLIENKLLEEANLLRCPVYNVEYIYDPQTAKVYCPNQEHQNY